jgi:hypothetical protein
MPGCAFSKNDNDVRYDIDVPLTDGWGNATDHGFGTHPPYYGPGLNPVGLPHKFGNGYIRSDEEETGVVAASINATDYAAQQIRYSPNYDAVIYTIGLGGNSAEPVDDTLLERIANDPRSPIYDSKKKAGFYAYAADASQLNAAFTQVASQILRLSK